MPAILRLWQQRIEDWQQSGESIAQWCREHNVVYHLFMYWKKRIGLNSQKGKASQAKFVEIRDDQSMEDTGVTIEYQGLQVRMAHNFDNDALFRCLQTLKRL